MKGKKTGGRVAGTPNRKTAKMREIIMPVVRDYFTSEQFVQDVAQLEPRDRVTVMEKLLSYTTPKPQSVSLTTEEDTQVTIDVRLQQYNVECGG